MSTIAILWLLCGFILAVALTWLWSKFSHIIHNWRYGDAAQHQEILASYSRHMASLITDRQAIARLLIKEIPDTLDISQAEVLFADTRELVSESGLRLPINNIAIRKVAAGGEAALVAGTLKKYLSQGRTDLSWTAVWIPLMRGTNLYGMWLLGRRRKNLTYASVHFQWLTTLAQQAAIILETVHHSEKEQLVANEMQALYHEAVSARESERNRLSRELHDGVLQELCAISRDLKALGAEANNGSLPRMLTTHANEAVHTLRAICHNLRPPFLTSNLSTALRALTERLNDASPGPAISFETSVSSLVLPEETTLAIYRIVQESLNNAIKHADASEIMVRLTHYPERLRLTISDDGRGDIRLDTDLGYYVTQGHFGLAGMRERAKMTGAALDIQSAKDYGTVVILEVPLTSP